MPRSRAIAFDIWGGAGYLRGACGILRFERVHGASEIVGFTRMTETAGATTPTDIELETGGRRVRIVWGDGRRSEFDWEYLRWHCPCALCSGEGEYPGELQNRTELKPEETEMVDLELVGRYAVRPTWRNGHDTGIFTFRNLRALSENDALLT